MRHLTLPALLALAACPAPTEEPSTPDVDIRVVDTDDPSDTGDTDDPGAACAEPQAVLDVHCTSCHGDFAVDGLDLRALSRVLEATSSHTGEALFVPGDPDASYLIAKIEGRHDVGVSMPPGDDPMPEADLAVLRDWITDGALCDDEPDFPEAAVDPNDLDQDALFVCDGAPASSPARLRRIDKYQFRRRAGLPADHPIASNPLEAAQHAAYSSYADGAALDPATLDLYLDMVPLAGGPWVGTNTWNRGARVSRLSVHDCMYKDSAPSEECVHAFAEDYLRHGPVLGEPDPAEVERLTAFAVTTLAEEAEGGRNASIRTITSAAWLHTSALFEAEVGVSEADAYGRHHLTDNEMAAWLASLVTDRGPDATSMYLYDNNLSGDERWTDDGLPHLNDIARAAEDGTIQDPTLAAALLRNAAVGFDPDREDEWIDYGSHSLAQRRRRAEAWMGDRLDRFFLEWFDVLQFESGFQDRPQATSVWHDHNSYYGRSLDDLRSYEAWSEPDGLMVFTDTVAQVVADDEEVLRKLLTTNEWYLPATTGSQDLNYRIFGLESSISASREGRWNSMPPGDRAGLLTHPIWLASHGDAFEDGPSIVHRGKWVREKLFCETVPPLELVSVAAMLPEGDGTETARERIEQGIETRSECMACHQYMNSLGKPFELYNHAGMVRYDDHGLVPDGSTFIDNAPDPALNGTYDDPMAFVEALADSPHVKRCFVRQTFRFFAGRNETPADACALSAMEVAYDESGGSFVSMLEALATHDTFTQRTWEEE